MPCRLALKAFLPADEQLVSCSPAVGGFSAARVFRVVTTRATYALRASPASLFQADRVEGLQGYLEFLKSEGFPVAVPECVVASPVRKFVDAGVVWQLEPWLKGAPHNPDESLLSGARLVSVMQVLARLHRVSMRYESTKPGSEWFRVSEGVCPAVRERLELIRSWNSQRIAESSERLLDAPAELRNVLTPILNGFLIASGGLQAELEVFKGRFVQLHPCWRDLWSEHVLFTGDQVTGLIDANAARSDHCSTDLSRLLGSYFGDDWNQWEGALEEYCQHRPLSLEDEQLVRLMDRSGVLLSGMTWVQRCLSGQVPTDQMEKCLARIEKILPRFLKLLTG